jgi:hypothetical protein
MDRMKMQEQPDDFLSSHAFVKNKLTTRPLSI